MILYHGSKEIFTEIKNDGLFGGVFATSDIDAAASHGNIIHKIELGESDVLLESDITWEVDYNDVLNAFTKITGLTEDDTDFQEGWSAIIEDDYSTGLESWNAEQAWEYQRLRGQVAQELGFKAVVMQDEHGTTYLVLPGAKLELACGN